MENNVPLTIYEASTPVFIRGLGNLSILLDKAAAYSETHRSDPDALIEARLAPDMFTLAGQIQAGCDAAKACIGRLADVERPSFPDTEKSFPELQNRIGKTVDFIEHIEREKIEAGGDRNLTIKIRGTNVDLAGSVYLLQFALPNFFFHMTTAYDILRHNGLQIGKMDYLGTF
jgi:hypothetical protein